MNEPEVRKLVCALCDKECYMTFSMQYADDAPWGATKGICYDCMRAGDLDQKMYLKNKKFIEEQIENAESHVKTWKDYLAELHPPE